ncbi:MAG: hypothetical protein IH946_13050 [Bacteroidetes bacterium]|nr:hypothetical protein [Bacteroidota bacterium]
MTEITLKLSVEETNNILQALGSLPYIQVNQLIQKVQVQAGNQLQELQNGNDNGTGNDKKKEKEKVVA